MNMQLSLSGIDTRERRSLLRRSALCIIVGSIVGGLIIGVLDRPHAQQTKLTVLNGTTQPAGGSFKVQLLGHFPAQCTPQWTRYVEYPRTAGQLKADAQLLPSDPVPTDLNPNIPIPISAIERCGQLHIDATLQGCGPLNGLFPSAPIKSRPVDVCIGPRVPVPAVPAP